jgi:hypothetical protein
METSDIANQKEVQNSTIGRKNVVDKFLGCTSANSVTLPGRGTTLNSVRCSEMLRDQLKPAIRTKRPELSPYRNVCLHSAAHIPEGLRQLNFVVVLKHPPNGPGLAPSNHNLLVLSTTL